MQSEHASLDQLTKVPFVRVLTYPRISLRSASARVRQLRDIGVDELVFEGRAKVGRLGILGLGTVGIVVKAKSGGSTYALKIRRLDSNRPTMAEEVRITTMANRLGIGPTVRAHSKDLLLMDLLEPEEISEWLRRTRGAGQRAALREMVHLLLNQCRKLDIMGIDHGQLSNLRKHAVIAGGKPWIIDFESAGTSRKTKNVTAAAQHLLVGGKVAKSMRRTLGIRDTAPVIRALSDYKSDMSDYHYAKLLEIARLVRP